MAVSAPIILFQNLFEDNGIDTVTSAEADYPKENLEDWRLDTKWRSTSNANQTIRSDAGATLASAANAVFLAGHNLGTKTATMSVNAYASSDYSSGGVNLLTKSFTDDLPYYGEFSASSTLRYWEVKITSIDSNYAEAAILAIGRKYQFPVLPEDGYDPDNQESAGIVNRAVGGAFVGASFQAATRVIRADFRYMDEDDAQEYEGIFDEYIRRLRPFCFVPDFGTYATRAYLMTAVDNPKLNLITEASYRHLSVEFIGEKIAEYN